LHPSAVVGVGMIDEVGTMATETITCADQTAATRGDNCPQRS